MFPALAPAEAHLVNDRSLSIRFNVKDVTVHIMVNPEGRWVYHHILTLDEDGHAVTVHSA